MERRVNKLESVVQEQEQTMAGLREQIQELQSENEQLRAQSSVDKKRNQDHDTKRVAKVEAELNEAMNRNSALEKKLEALQKKLRYSMNGIFLACCSILADSAMCLLGVDTAKQLPRSTRSRSVPRRDKLQLCKRSKVHWPCVTR